MRNVCNSIITYVVKFREIFLQISTQFASFVIFFLLLSAISSTCYFSSPPCFQHFFLFLALKK